MLLGVMCLIAFHYSSKRLGSLRFIDKLFGEVRKVAKIT